MLTDILTRIGLRYDPDKYATPAPDKPVGSPVRRTSPAKPDNLVYDKADGTARTYTDTEAGRTWELYGLSEGQRTPYLTDADKYAIARRGLQEDKFVLIKHKWATMKNGRYLSSRQASRELTTAYGPGYSHRTVQRYYAAINAAAPTPSPYPASQ